MASPGLRAPRWAIYAWMVLILGLIAFLWWTSDRALEQEARLRVLVEERRTPATMTALRDCLDARGADTLGLGNDWGPPKGLPDTRRSRNDARHIQVDLVERGDHRLVRFYTREGRPLRASERAMLERCAAP